MSTTLSSNFFRTLLRIGMAPLLLLTLSCASFGSGRHNEKDLLLAEKDFIKAMKWGDYKHASGWVAPEAKEDFWKHVDRFQNHLHVMEYEIRDVIFEPGDPSGIVLLKCRYYYTSDPQLKTKTLRHKWIYSDDLSGWQLQGHDLDKLLDE